MFTHCGFTTPYGDIDLGQYCSGNGSVPDLHQAISWTDADLPSVGFCGTRRRPMPQELLIVSICKMSLKTLKILLQHVPGANELAKCDCSCCTAMQPCCVFSPSHKSDNASDEYPTVYYFVTEICTHAHFCYNMLQCGIGDGCIVGFMQQVYATDGRNPPSLLLW